MAAAVTQANDAVLARADGEKGKDKDKDTNDKDSGRCGAPGTYMHTYGYVIRTTY